MYKFLRKMLRKLIHPVMALIAIQLVWISLVVSWVYWYVGKNRELSELARKYAPELGRKALSWAVLAQGLVMLAVILAGVYVIFVYWKRQSNLYAKQRNFITQVTHELKSPLASIQLHLETIRLRQLPQERLNAFVTTMLSDTERLHYLINNLLMAARLEQPRRPVERRLIDASALLTEYVERERCKLPEGGSITLDVEPGVRLNAAPEELGMVMRNLFENAVLYSPGSPEIHVALLRDGNTARLKISDKGRGLDASELKKVFEMFYRVQTAGENVRGTGLGLYIVQSIIRGYRGTVAVESEGPGRGCTFILTMPMA
ncbi:MAG TPA: HAMP domain-containing sensor histidine kinase [Deltaproteobacteria bacterium]|nr:HAMP domain-containing sensor histidine kinase [Deltaproteobacteria bacterium]HQB39559.1 HAMP domain-containing sensor histidine kinase [Deltaproteobacteria bacterium]